MICGMCYVTPMLPKEYRLTRMKDFEILFKEGRFVGGGLVTAKVWHVQPEKYPRRAYSSEDLKIGFVVSTKISKSAVKRNRAKRQMREVVRLLLKEDRLKHGFMLSIMAKSAVLSAEYGDIAADVVGVLRRAQILK